jgi:hypothetical protein
MPLTCSSRSAPAWTRPDVWLAGACLERTLIHAGDDLHRAAQAARSQLDVDRQRREHKSDSSMYTDTRLMYEFSSARSLV